MIADWAVIYYLINNEDYSSIESIKDEYFTEELARNAFIYIKELLGQLIKVTPEIVVSKFPEIEKNLDIEIDKDQFSEFVNIIKNNFIEKRIKQIGRNIVSKQHIDQATFTKYIDNFLSEINVSSCNKTKSAADITVLLEEEINSDEEPSSSIKYGIESLDKATGGIFRGTQLIIAGRPSMGKSVFMGHIAVYNALRNEPTLILSLEMNPKIIMKRMLAGQLGIEMWKLNRISSRSIEEQKKVTDLLTKFKAMPIEFEDSTDLTVSSLGSIIQKFILRHGKISLIVLDYLQLMSGEDEASDNARIGAISRALKKFTIKYDCVSVVGSQLSRACEQRDNKRPILSDLRDSGTIEQDADIVMMLYRDVYYNPNPDHERILEAIIRKNRNGETGKYLIEFNKYRQSLASITEFSNLGKIAKKFMYE